LYRPEHWADNGLKRQEEKREKERLPGAIRSKTLPNVLILPQKQKLKVGKTRPKADNQTNTSFRAKGRLSHYQIDRNNL
jgi:hypothetical protein